MVMAQSAPNTFVVLMADDDLDDIMLVRDALKDSGCEVDFRYVEDGDEAVSGEMNVPDDLATTSAEPGFDQDAGHSLAVGSAREDEQVSLLE